MPDITDISPDGTSTTLEARLGDSVMEVAVKHGVEGIVAECGGACSCATCHVYLDPTWADRVPPITDEEDEMLEGTASPRTAESRLSCQIPVTDAIDGLTVTIAPED